LRIETLNGDPANSFFYQQSAKLKKNGKFILLCAKDGGDGRSGLV